MKRLRVVGLLFCLALLTGTASAQNTADTAFQWSVKLDIPDSSGFSFASYTVPTGKRLIIRYLAATSTLLSGQRLTSSLQATLRGFTAEFPQAYAAQSNGDGTDEVVSTQAGVIQADGDSTVYFQVFRKIPKGGIRIVFAMSGDLVTMP